MKAFECKYTNCTIVVFGGHIWWSSISFNFQILVIINDRIYYQKQSKTTDKCKFIKHRNPIRVYNLMLYFT